MNHGILARLPSAVGLFRITIHLCKAVTDILVPQRCAVCGSLVGSDAYFLCEKCMEDIILTEENCPTCGGRMEGETCNLCAQMKWYVTRNVPVAEYRGVMKEALYALKFRGKQAIHIPLARLAIGAIQRAGLSYDIVTFVPMEAIKTRSRGYNQSKLIAQRIAKETSKPCVALLAERRGGKTQRELSARERFLNTLCRYRLRKGARANGGSVLLVDDVFTTGSTINQCARLLLEAGFREVFSLTLARAEIKGLKCYGTNA